MDRLVKTAAEQKWNPEAYARDQWVKNNAKRLPKGSWVLDAGAGACKYGEFFQHCRYETQDFCQYEGELVRYTKSITYVCDISAIPIPSGALDAILCTEVFEHLVDPLAALTEFARILKPDGFLLLTAPMVSASHMQPYHFFGGFTHFWYEHWFPEKGFRIETITPVGGPARTFAAFGQNFYMQWAAKERELGLVNRGFSKLARLFAKFGVNHFLPAVAPALDAWLGASSVCSGYMVVGRRKPGAISESHRTVS